MQEALQTLPGDPPDAPGHTLAVLFGATLTREAPGYASCCQIRCSMCNLHVFFEIKNYVFGDAEEEEGEEEARRPPSSGLLCLRVPLTWSFGMGWDGMDGLDGWDHDNDDHDNDDHHDGKKAGGGRRGGGGSIHANTRSPASGGTYW